MADDLSEVGDATEIADESFSKDFNSTVETQKEEVYSQVSENIEKQLVEHVEMTQDNSDTEGVSNHILLYCTFSI